jgi:hypothetical protein
MDGMFRSSRIRPRMFIIMRPTLCGEVRFKNLVIEETRRTAMEAMHCVVLKRRL